MILQSMGNRGNIPAAILKDELDGICRLISNLPSSPRNNHETISSACITVIEDGQNLHAAILVAIEIPLSTDCHNNSHDLLETRALDTVAQGQWPRSGNQEPTTSAATQGETQGRSQPLEDTGGARSNDIYLVNNAEAAENPFTFDIGDLQWLDAVQ